MIKINIIVEFSDNLQPKKLFHFDQTVTRSHHNNFRCWTSWQNLFFTILALFQQFSETHTAAQQLLGGGIQIRAELGKCSNLTVLCKLKFHGAGHLLHGTRLSSRSDTGNGKTDVNGWSNTLVKQLSFQENLAVSNGNDVGRDVSRDVTSLEIQESIS